MNDIFDEIEDRLRCIICYDITGKSFHCVNSHVTCESCYERSKNNDCSLCGDGNRLTNNNNMIELAKKTDLKFSCGINGCKHTTNIQTLDSHRLTCSYLKFTCPFKCAEEFTINTLANHVTRNHKYYVAEMKQHETLWIVCFNTSQEIIVFNNDPVIILNVTFAVSSILLAPRFLCVTALCLPRLPSFSFLEIASWSPAYLALYIFLLI